MMGGKAGYRVLEERDGQCAGIIQSECYHLTALNSHKFIYDLFVYRFYYLLIQYLINYIQIRQK